VLIAQLASAAYPSAADIPLESGLGKGCEFWVVLEQHPPFTPFRVFDFAERGHTFGNRQSRTKEVYVVSVIILLDTLDTKKKLRRLPV